MPEWILTDRAVRLQGQAASVEIKELRREIDALKGRQSSGNANAHRNA